MNRRSLRRIPRIGSNGKRVGMEKSFVESGEEELSLEKKNRFYVVIQMEVVFRRRGVRVNREYSVRRRESESTHMVVVSFEQPCWTAIVCARRVRTVRVMRRKYRELL